MLASGFELINLAATLAEPQMPESSDDGLDPNEFLSQSHVPLAPPRANTISPIPIENIDMTPKFLNSELFTNPNMLSESDVLVESINVDSFHFVSADSMYRNTHSRMSSTGESPLEHLQSRNQALNNEMRNRLRVLESTLANGEDCTEIRESLTNGLALLSENKYLLHEIYNKELAFVNALLVNFENWDRNRSRVLRRIQAIKSEGNRHGKKLAGLLNKQTAIDDEIQQLESRIEVLRANRGAITKEIDETSSILESKSAKYVNIFRDLERQGRDAISEYLYSSGIPKNNLEILLKSEPVEATFSYIHDNQRSDNTINIASDTRGIEHPKAANTQSEEPKITASTMGIQPLIISGDEPEVDPGVPQVEEESAYAMGYARGSQRLEKLRKGISNIVTHVFPPVQNGHKSAKNVDDQLNVITEKIDLVPIIELLSHKSDALSKLTVDFSKLAAEYHDQNVILKDIYRSLGSNERTIISLLSNTSPSPEDLVSLLSKSYSELKKVLERQLESRVRSSGPKNKYLITILHLELTAVAKAMSELSQNSSYELQVPLLGSSVDSSMLDSRAEFRNNFAISGITSAGYRPPTHSTTFTSHASPTVYKVRQDSPFASSSKGLKNE